jgi:hypothetical protein
MNTKLSDKIVDFYSKLKITSELPEGVKILNPYGESEVKNVLQTFYRKYYHDNNERFLILGINPGRFGAGVTGIPFTDPVQLETKCGIINNFDKKPELSSIFIYRMIEAYGSVGDFYQKFFISSISPLGFMKDGKNLNYYDIKSLQTSLNDFMVKSIKQQLKFGINKEVCFCLGQGKNYKFLMNLNDKYNFFGKIIPLAHPRYILQYKRKYVQDYINEFLMKLTVY